MTNIFIKVANWITALFGLPPMEREEKPIEKPAVYSFIERVEEQGEVYYLVGGFIPTYYGSERYARSYLDSAAARTTAADLTVHSFYPYCHPPALRVSSLERAKEYKERIEQFCILEDRKIDDGFYRRKVEIITE